MKEICFDTTDCFSSPRSMMNFGICSSPTNPAFDIGCPSKSHPSKPFLLMLYIFRRRYCPNDFGTLGDIFIFTRQACSGIDRSILEGGLPLSVNDVTLYSAVLSLNKATLAIRSSRLLPDWVLAISSSEYCNGRRDNRALLNRSASSFYCIFCLIK